MASDIRAGQRQPLVELRLRQRVYACALVDEAQRDVAPGVVGSVVLEAPGQPARFSVVTLFHQVHRQAPESNGVGRVGVQGTPERV